MLISVPAMIEPPLEIARVIVSTAGTLVLYLICCLGLLRLRARGVATAGPPFRAPGGSFVPLAAAAMIIWLLSTLAWAELAPAMVLVVVSGAAYALQERWRRERVGAIALQASTPLVPLK